MTETGFLNENQETIKYLKKIPAMECFSEQDLETFMRFSEVRTYTENELII